jgi:hypothetical protein
MDSTPRQTIIIFNIQNPRKQAHNSHSMLAMEGQMTTSIEWMAVPPIHD